MATQRPATMSDSLRLPRGFPILARDDGEHIWVDIRRANPEELRLFLGYRLWKLWHELQEIRDFAAFTAASARTSIEVPDWLDDPGPLPLWVDAISTEDYQALDREWIGATDAEGDEVV